jgi:hypothetical protein
MCDNNHPAADLAWRESGDGGVTDQTSGATNR